MRLPKLCARGALIACIAGGFLLALPALASAQERPKPVLDSAPAEIQYRGTAVVTGHMENGTGGERITLQKYRAGRWQDLQTRSVDANGRVSFRMEDVTKTADYRLMWVAPDGTETPSDGRAKIRVEARVTMTASRHHVMSGRRVNFSGWVLPIVNERQVVLQQKVDGEWRFLARRPVVDGKFTHELRLRRKGYRRFRAIFRGDELNTRSDGEDFVKVYRRGYATWYGPGFYGNRTACGQRLHHGTLGVAHRTLPCGTEISFMYKSRTITVSVIDRGPYSRADWDLTEETAERLRFKGGQGSGTIGVLGSSS